MSVVPADEFAYRIACLPSDNIGVVWGVGSKVAIDMLAARRGVAHLRPWWATDADPADAYAVDEGRVLPDNPTGER